LERFSIRAAVLNSELPTNSRYDILQKFNSGEFQYLIATDETLEQDHSKKVPKSKIKIKKEEESDDDIVVEDDFDAEIEQMEQEEDEESGNEAMDDGENGNENEDEDEEADELEKKMLAKSKNKDNTSSGKQEKDPKKSKKSKEEESQSEEEKEEEEEEEEDDEEDDEEEEVVKNTKKNKKVEEKELETENDETHKLVEVKKEDEDEGANYGVTRGIDFKGVETVVNFDFALEAKEYIHRIGRTARGGARGSALSLITPRDMEVFEQVKKEKKELLIPYKLNKSVIEGLRYRVEDVLKSCSRHDIATARLKEIKMEILNSEHLKMTLETDRVTKSLLMKHDRDLMGKKKSCDICMICLVISFLKQSKRTLYL